MAHSYDPQNIFARILRGEIPNKTAAETAHTLAFHDINPAAPTHVLVIPKGPYVTFDHFLTEASPAEQADFNATVARLCQGMEGGYRVISNAGAHGMQEVPHFHLHILSGRPLGRLVEKA